LRAIAIGQSAAHMRPSHGPRLPLGTPVVPDE
jgi:hypothetical protein